MRFVLQLAPSHRPVADLHVMDVEEAGEAGHPTAIDSHFLLVSTASTHSRRRHRGRRDATPFAIGNSEPEVEGCGASPASSRTAAAPGACSLLVGVPTSLV
ncbi:hypothetical protein E2562_020157 [Oryza meyeriana var. granulata]|uniref:Uncharacterized protein n=1 Tax=Oryza meyeriana var. granulata TaxID=110450 RepID=A0A6G1BLV0_9ORYZ|nr:hypothetical protein E2562_020157 [Oryza meyeriana var. granulata]